jgi:diadenosine tetraphosphate (Ap4A) HIT family hydrolase
VQAGMLFKQMVSISIFELSSLHRKALICSGTEAGQTVPHSHFHIIPRLSERGSQARDASEIADAERKNIALGEGPRVKLEDSEGKRLMELINEKVTLEVDEMKSKGEVAIPALKL